MIYGFGLIRVIENGRSVRISAAFCALHGSTFVSRENPLDADRRPYGITHSVVYHDISDLLAF